MTVVRASSWALLYPYLQCCCKSISLDMPIVFSLLLNLHPCAVNQTMSFLTAKERRPYQVNTAIKIHSKLMIY